MTFNPVPQDPLSRSASGSSPTPYKQAPSPVLSLDAGLGGVTMGDAAMMRAGGEAGTLVSGNMGPAEVSGIRCKRVEIEVTVAIIWTTYQGLSTLPSYILYIRGNLGNLHNLHDLHVRVIIGVVLKLTMNMLIHDRSNPAEYCLHALTPPFLYLSRTWCDAPAYLFLFADNGSRSRC